MTRSSGGVDEQGTQPEGANRLEAADTAAQTARRATEQRWASAVIVAGGPPMAGGQAEGHEGLIPPAEPCRAA